MFDVKLPDEGAFRPRWPDDVQPPGKNTVERNTPFHRIARHRIDLRKARGAPQSGHLIDPFDSAQRAVAVEGDDF
jgi:hypothetical protein